MMKKDVIRRYKKNPILTKEDVPYPVSTVHNAAVVKRDDTYIMIFRSHRRDGRSILGIAKSSNGFKFKVESSPFMVPSTHGEFMDYEEYGIEDPRITFLEGFYWITYSAYSSHGVRIGLAKTKDFLSVERVAFISQCDTRNCVLFPEKIDGCYIRLDRPHTELNPYPIWISYSKDLIHWGNSKVIMKPKVYHWTSMKIGPGAPPLKTPHGWINLFHGVYNTMDGAVYRIGVALHDLLDPSKILGISDEWVLEPEASYERVGYVHNVVFLSGAILEKDDSIKLYWGGADTVMCAGETTVDELLGLCRGRDKKF